MKKETSNNSEKLIFEEFLRDLEKTAEQVKDLLDEINDSKIELASIKTELKFIVENVKDLSSIIKDGHNGVSVLTKIALIEKSIEEIQKYIEQDSIYQNRLSVVEEKVISIQTYLDTLKDKNVKEKEVLLAKISGKWALYAAVFTGLCGIVATIITVIVSLMGN